MFDREVGRVDAFVSSMIVVGLPDNHPEGYANLTFEERSQEDADSPDIYTYGTRYDTFPGKLFRGHKDVTRKAGYDIEILGVFSFSHGAFREDHRQTSMDTKGWGLHSRGLIKLVKPSAANAGLIRLLQKISLSYYHSEYINTRSIFHNETTSHSLVVNIRL